MAVQSASANAVTTDEHPTQRYLRLHGVLGNPEDVAYRYNLLTNRFEYVSPAITCLLGFSVDELLAMDLAETVDRIHIDPSTLQTTPPDGSTILHYRFRAKDGSYQSVEDQYLVVTDAEDRPRYRIGVMRDMSSRKTDGSHWHCLPRARRACTAIPRALGNVLPEPHRSVLRRHGLKIAAMVVALIQLAAGAGLYRTAERVMSHTQPTIQITHDRQETEEPSAHAAFQQEVDRLVTERDRLQQRVAALEQRMTQVSTELRTVREQQVAAATTISPQPASTTPGRAAIAPRPELSWIRTRGWFTQSPIPSIAPDPPSWR